MTTVSRRTRARVVTGVRRWLRSRGQEVVPIEEPRFQTSGDETASAGIDGAYARARLDELRARYSGFDGPASAHTYWTEERVGKYVDLDTFRGQTMFVWQYEERPLLTEYKFFVYLAYLESMDHAGLLESIVEDGAFGAPQYTFPGRPPVSRDSLDSVNEILFLDREMDILSRNGLRVLDIGAGYGRLAHRMSQAVVGLTDYTCVDAIPESTLSCELYLSHRGVLPPCRVVELPDAEESVKSSSFDLAVNVHSFSEMSAASAAFWIELAGDAGIGTFFVVPNHPTALLSHEADGSTIDLVPIFESAGYHLDKREPIVRDEAARALFGVDDHFHLFRRA